MDAERRGSRNFKLRGVHDPNALYIVFSGSNDIGDSLNPRRSESLTVISAVITVILDAVQAFADAGA